MTPAWLLVPGTGRGADVFGTYCYHWLRFTFYALTPCRTYTFTTRLPVKTRAALPYIWITTRHVRIFISMQNTELRATHRQLRRALHFPFPSPATLCTAFHHYNRTAACYHTTNTSLDTLPGRAPAHLPIILVIPWHFGLNIYHSLCPPREGGGRVWRGVPHPTYAGCRLPSGAARTRCCLRGSNVRSTVPCTVAIPRATTTVCPAVSIPHTDALYVLLWMHSLARYALPHGFLPPCPFIWTTFRTRCSHLLLLYMPHIAATGSTAGTCPSLTLLPRDTRTVVSTSLQACHSLQIMVAVQFL